MTTTHIISPEILQRIYFGSGPGPVLADENYNTAWWGDFSLIRKYYIICSYGRVKIIIYIDCIYIRFLDYLSSSCTIKDIIFDNSKLQKLYKMFGWKKSFNYIRSMYENSLSKNTSHVESVPQIILKYYGSAQCGFRFRFRDHKNASFNNLPECYRDEIMEILFEVINQVNSEFYLSNPGDN